MRGIRALLSFLLSLLILGTTVLNAAAQSNEVIDEIVALVGDQIILRSEVNGFVEGIARQQQLTRSDRLWADALNQLIDFKVLAEHARRDTTIQVEDAQVEQALDQRIDQLSAQVGGRGQLESLYGKSVSQIKADLRSDFRDQLLAEQFQSQKLQKIRITPTEVRQWFDEIPVDSLPELPEMVRIAHIVRYPKVTDAAREEARSILSTIRDSILSASSSLEAMARRFSDDPGSASRGGRYGFTKLSDLEPEFAAIASRIPINELSQVFETRHGAHVLRVNDRRGDVVDFNHILIQYDLSRADPSEALDYLSMVRDSLMNQDVSFGVMARRHSEEAQSARQGGRVVDPRNNSRDLPLAALGSSWRSTIASIEPGEISEPSEVELLDGQRAYHVMMLERHTPAHRLSLEADYERIQEFALQEKREREYRKWIAQLRDGVYIEYRGKAKELVAASS